MTHETRFAAEDLDALAVPKHKRLELALRDMILRGEYGPGERLPAEKELMRHYGYSYATVSRAVKALAAAGLVKRTRGRGTFVTSAARRGAGPHRGSARPAGAATSTRPRIPASLAHFHGGYPAGFHPFFSALLEGFVGAAAEHGMTMKFSSAPDGVLNVNESFLERHEIAGFSVSNARRVDLQAAIRLGLPVVDISGWWKDVRSDRVRVDIQAGRREAMAHLKDLGHERIAVLDTRPKADAREAAANVFDCLPTDAPVEEVYVGGYGAREAEKGLSALRELGPELSAVLVGDDFLLAHFLRTAQDRGISIPEDLSVVGWGTPFSAQMLGREVTMVEADPRQISRAAVELLVEQIDGNRAPGEVRTVTPRLVVRKSTGRRRQVHTG